MAEVKLSDIPCIPKEDMFEGYSNIIQATSTMEDITLYFMQAEHLPGGKPMLMIRAAITISRNQANQLRELIGKVVTPPLDIIPGGLDPKKMN